MIRIICFLIVFQSMCVFYIGVDTVKNDGFYSATLLNFQNDGTFPVKVRAAAREGNQTRLVTNGGSRAFRLPVINGSE